MAPLYFVSFLLVMVLYLVNMFVAILNDLHEDSRQAVATSELDMWTFVHRRACLYLGLGRVASDTAAAHTTHRQSVLVVSDELAALDAKFRRMAAQAAAAGLMVPEGGSNQTRGQRQRRKKKAAGAPQQKTVRSALKPQETWREVEQPDPPQTKAASPRSHRANRQSWQKAQDGVYVDCIIEQALAETADAAEDAA